MTLSELDRTLNDIGEAAASIEQDERLLHERVKAARAEGASWTDVAEALGVTRQSAWERWHERV